MNSTVKMVSYMGIYLAIFLIFGFVPYLGFIGIGPISITTLKLVCFIIIFIHKDWRYALFAGIAFGFTSMLIAATMPKTPIDPYFVNPLISLLPRIIFALSVWVMIYWTDKLLKNKKWLYLISLPIIFISSVIHGFLVLLFLFIFIKAELLKIFGLIITTNSLIELAIALIAVPFLHKRISLAFNSVNNSETFHFENKNSEDLTS